jgi:hypothetical protein
LPWSTWAMMAIFRSFSITCASRSEDSVSCLVQAAIAENLIKRLQRVGRGGDGADYRHSALFSYAGR